MTPARHYKSFIYDSSRWEHLARRDEDIIITTPAESGTTWMQMCCCTFTMGEAGHGANWCQRP